MNKKIWVLIILVIIAVAGYLFFLSTRIPTISGLEVAVKTASFLDKTIQPDGSFIAGYSCDSSKPQKCSEPIPLSLTQPHVGQAIFAYFLLGEETKDKSYREKADRAMEYVLNACATNAKVCEWNFFPLAHYYKTTQDEKYLKGMLRPAEGLVTMNQDYIVFSNAGHKLLSLYEATGDTRYRERLLEVADAELEKEKNVPVEKRAHRVIQDAWSVYLPAYRLTKDTRYLRAAELLFDKFDIASNLEQFSTPTNLLFAVKGADALLSLAEISPNQELYKRQAHSLLQALLHKLWDTPRNLKFDGDYGFTDVISDGQVAKAHKSALTNGWLIKSYLRMGKELFEEPVVK